MNTTTQLSVNVNKVALVRNTRHLGIPGVTRGRAVPAGRRPRHHRAPARPDRRHIRAADVRELAR